MIATIDNAGVFHEAFYINADDKNRLHVHRGNLMSVKKGSVISRGLFIEHEEK